MRLPELREKSENVSFPNVATLPESSTRLLLNVVKQAGITSTKSETRASHPIA